MSKQVNEGQAKREDSRRAIKEHERNFNSECARLAIMPSVDSQALERQAIRMVEQLVARFTDIQTLLQKDDVIKQAVEYYKGFSSDVMVKGEIPLGMLSYMVEHGDQNVAIWTFQKTNPGVAISGEL